MAQIAQRTLTELKKLADAGKLVLGTARTLKQLKTGKAQKVYLAKNCSKTAREDVQHYASLGRVEVTELEMLGDELGAACRKQFSITVLSIAKE